ncbi:hypothetical protein EMIHUDRAFT_311223 [Emiliania huxleyi CCMP1516]|uniref:Bicarbonate transporter-like transmembrane domain-containing protein n=2 Tax=Emiliania huxleyi TaxID=2903 RepID=A0A0D3IRJ1_EMIH1|nr:hypothetical protein EMIHUDRAFT_311223 [Emiliania huxleyi CCMP1516]EOD13876.1 hypothetical protein EMIHUDRAFT_311223 [Emiliania huxleyi CCMP1516]|eukprot:XP_005766305.1 hypothetical protein EMIHUDRAFT_311223 [Emiliania huxleyi CCMP1516]
MGLFGSDSPSKKEETAPLVTPEKEGLRQRRKSPFTKADEEKKDKIDQLVLAASDKVSPQVAEWLKKAAPAIRAISQAPPSPGAFGRAIATIAPFYIMAAKKLYEIGNKLPWDILQAVIGLGLCFFGGGYCASIAAAFALTGWPTTRQALIDVYEEAANVLDANEEDDKKDEDKNGVRDIDEAKTRDTILEGRSGGQRAMGLFGSDSPSKKEETAPLTRFMQTFISGVQSSIKGGFMFSRGVMAHLWGTGHKNLGPLSLDSEDFPPPPPPNRKAFGYSVAALGFYIQWSWGFGLPFPLSLVMLPFDILEWYIRWSISSGGE